MVEVSSKSSKPSKAYFIFDGFDDFDVFDDCDETTSQIIYSGKRAGSFITEKVARISLTDGHVSGKIPCRYSLRDSEFPGRGFITMMFSCVQNRKHYIPVSDYSARSPHLCRLSIIILIQLPAAVGGSEATLMLDSAMT